MGTCTMGTRDEDMNLDILFNNPLEQLDELALEAKRLKQKYEKDQETNKRESKIYTFSRMARNVSIS